MAQPARETGGTWAADEPRPPWLWHLRLREFQQLQGHQGRREEPPPRHGNAPDPTTPPLFTADNRSYEPRVQQARERALPLGADDNELADAPASPWPFPGAMEVRSHLRPQPDPYWDYGPYRPSNFDAHQACMPGPYGRGNTLEPGLAEPQHPAAGGGHPLGGFQLPLTPAMARRQGTFGEEASPANGQACAAPAPMDNLWRPGARYVGMASKDSGRAWETGYAMGANRFSSEGFAMVQDAGPAPEMRYWEPEPRMPPREFHSQPISPAAAWQSQNAPHQQFRLPQPQRHPKQDCFRMPPLMHPNDRQHNRRFEPYPQMGDGGFGGARGYDAAVRRYHHGGGSSFPCLNPVNSHWDARPEPKTPRMPWGAGGSSDSGATTPWRGQVDVTSMPVGCQVAPGFYHPDHANAGANMYRRASRGAAPHPRHVPEPLPGWEGNAKGDLRSLQATKGPKPPVGNVVTEEVESRRRPVGAGASHALEKMGIVHAGAGRPAMPAPAEVRGWFPLCHQNEAWWAEPELRKTSRAEQRAREQHGGMEPPASRSWVDTEGTGITGVGSCGGSANTSPSVRPEAACGSLNEKPAGCSEYEAGMQRGRALCQAKPSQRKRRRLEPARQQPQQISYDADESSVVVSDRGSMSPVVRSPAIAIVGSPHGGRSRVTEDGPSASHPAKA